MTTHKKCKGLEYQAWNRLIQACTNPNSKGWPNNGAKGVLFDTQFQTFIGFHEALGDMPAGCNALKRKDPSIGYFKENCYWGVSNRGRPRAKTKELQGLKKHISKFKNPMVLAVTIEADHLHYIRKQALIKSLEKGKLIEATDLVREALIKYFPLPKQYDMFGDKIK